jgi:hypothetical protein
MEFGIIGFIVIVGLAVGFVMSQRAKRQPQRMLDDEADLLITKIQEPLDDAQKRPS